jgi:hypothetical protein
MRLADFLQEIGRPIAYYPKLRRITGSTTATIFLCQLIYWSGKQKDPDGWIYKTAAEIEEETGLSEKEQRTARQHLKQRGLIEERYARLEHRMYYRVILEAVNAAWEARDDEAGGDDKGRSRTDQREVREQTDGQVGNRPMGRSNKETEITTETTTETTHQRQKPQRTPSPAETVLFDTPEARRLQAALWSNAKAKGRRGPTRFATLQQKRKFLRAVEALGERFDYALEKGLEQGITGLGRLVNWLASPKWNGNGGWQDASYRRGDQQIVARPAAAPVDAEQIERDRQLLLEHRRRRAGG